MREGLAWLDAALTAETRSDTDKDPARVRALIDKGLLHGWLGSTEGLQIDDEALAFAREIGDSALVIRGLVAHGTAYAYDVEAAAADFLEAGELARELDDRWRLSQILAGQAVAGMRWANSSRSMRRPARAATLPTRSVTTSTRVDAEWFSASHSCGGGSCVGLPRSCVTWMLKPQRPTIRSAVQLPW